MRSPADIAKHRIHPMLVTIPIGFWIFSFVCDLIHAFGAESPNWENRRAIQHGRRRSESAAGRDSRTHRSALAANQAHRRMRMTINLIVVALLAASACLRIHGRSENAIWLSAIAIGLLAISGWLGGKMVCVHGVAVETPPESAS